MRTIHGGRRRYYSRRSLIINSSVDENADVVIVDGKEIKYTQRLGRVLRAKLLKNLANTTDLHQLKENLEELIQIDCKEAGLPVDLFKSIQKTLRFIPTIPAISNCEEVHETIYSVPKLPLEPVQPLLAINRAPDSLGIEKEEMWTTGKVAKKLGVSNQTVVNWIQAGRLKGIKLPSGQYRVYANQFRTTDAQDAEFDAFFKEMAERHKDVLPLSDKDMEDL
ncbi:MAG: helix-turn-helix domain-containing protein [Desulfitobacteriaceae bacterium]